MRELIAIFGALAFPSRLRDVGIPADGLVVIAGQGMLDWLVRGNPRPVRDFSQLLSLLQQAW